MCSSDLTTLTAAMTKAFGEFKAYDQIDNAPEEKAREIGRASCRERV